MENTVIPRRIQMERFIPVESLRKKSNSFQVLPFSRLEVAWPGESRESLEALTICMENTVIPRRIQMERFIPVENFRKKSNSFQVLPFSRFDRNDQNFLYHSG